MFDDKYALNLLLIEAGITKYEILCVTTRTMISYGQFSSLDETPLSSFEINKQIRQCACTADCIIVFLEKNVKYQI